MYSIYEVAPPSQDVRRIYVARTRARVFVMPKYIFVKLSSLINYDKEFFNSSVDMTSHARSVNEWIVIQNFFSEMKISRYFANLIIIEKGEIEEPEIKERKFSY